MSKVNLGRIASSVVILAAILMIATLAGLLLNAYNQEKESTKTLYSTHLHEPLPYLFMARPWVDSVCVSTGVMYNGNDGHYDVPEILKPVVKSFFERGIVIKPKL